MVKTLVSNSKDPKMIIAGLAFSALLTGAALFMKKRKSSASNDDLPANIAA